MSVDLKALLESLKDQDTKVYEFPPDYQDTYDLGIEHGKIKLAKELYTLLGFREG